MNFDILPSFNSFLLAIASIATVMISPVFARWAFSQVHIFLQGEAQFLKSRDDFERFKFVKEIELTRLKKRYDSQIKSSILTDAQANDLYDLKKKIDTLVTQFERPNRLRKAFTEYQAFAVVSTNEQVTHSKANAVWVNEYYVYSSESNDNVSLPSEDYASASDWQNFLPPEYDYVPPVEYYDYPSPDYYSEYHGRFMDFTAIVPSFLPLLLAITADTDLSPESRFRIFGTIFGFFGDFFDSFFTKLFSFFRRK
jgi:hypothetical protein